MTTDDETAPGPLDGINPEEIMEVLVKPVADLVWAVQESGTKLIAMLLRHEFQRGYATGWQAAMREVHGPASPTTPEPAATLRDRTASETIRLSRPS